MMELEEQGSAHARQGTMRRRLANLAARGFSVCKETASALHARQDFSPQVKA